MRRSLCLGFVIASSLACSSGGSNPVEVPFQEDSGQTSADTDPNLGDGDLPGFTQVFVRPANAVVKIDLTGGTPIAGKQTFRAFELQGDKEVDVSDKTTFVLDDPSLGSFAGNVFTSATALPVGVLGKSTTVRAQPGNGLANVTVIALEVSGEQRDFFFTVPYQKDPDPAKDILKFRTNISQVDVAILMDTTQSMGEEIGNLRDALSSKIIPDLKKLIPNVGYAVAKFEDFPVEPFGYAGSTGSAGNTPYRLLQAVSTNESFTKSAVELLKDIYQGGALPESQYEAQYQLLTGEGFSWTAAKAGSIAAHAPKKGTSGGADFRSGSLPVVVQITDASWFEKNTYSTASGGKLAPHTHAEVVAAYDAIKAKFVGIHSLFEKPGGGMDTPCTNYANNSCDSARGYQQAVKMAQDTGSVLDPSAFKGCAPGKCCTGSGGAAQDPIGGKCPLVYLAKSNGTGVSDGIISAIEAISIGAAFDVTAIPSDDVSDADVGGNPVDATKFISKIRAMGEGDVASKCDPLPTKDTDGDGVHDTFIGVTVGRPVCFEVIPRKNETVKPAKDRPQFFKAFIDVVGMPGAVKLEQRDVLFLVPPAEQGPAK